jgi:hypothetical protein
VEFVDDYGHHPTEVATTLDAVAGLWKARRVVVVFQPHRYTRTRDLLDQFGAALGGADEVVLTDVYSAGEAPIAGATAEAVEAAVRRTGKPVRLVKALDEIPAAVAALARPNDLVITLGAGPIGSWRRWISRRWSDPAARPATGAAKAEAPDGGQGPGREELPPRPRPSGRPQGRLVRRLADVAGRPLGGGGRGRALCRLPRRRSGPARLGAAGPPHQRARQRAAVER